jgi:hypothetical protein
MMIVITCTVQMSLRLVSYLLAAISAVGAIAIPFGDPQFLDRAIILEVSFVALAILTFLGIRKALYACIPIAVAVMIGNSLAPPHVEIMTTFSKPFNAVLLIVGGYVLQAALLLTSAVELVRSRRQISKEMN